MAKVTCIVREDISVGYEYPLNIPFSIGGNDFYTTFTIRDYSSYEIGDIILADNTKISKNNIEALTQEQKDKAVCIVAYKNDKCVPICVGVNTSGNEIWAIENTKGYNTLFDQLRSGMSDINYDYGYPYSCKNNSKISWYYICAVDSTAQSHSTDYPVFDYALNYGRKNFPQTGYEEDWYIPSVIDFRNFKDNIPIIDKSLEAIGKKYCLKLHCANFWTCTQSDNANIGAVKVTNNPSSIVAKCVNYRKSIDVRTICIRPAN